MKQKIMDRTNVGDTNSVGDGDHEQYGIGKCNTISSTKSISPVNIMNCKEWNPGIMFTLKGTVILQIWWQILLVVIYTTSIVALDIAVPMEFTAALVPILGVVTGFLLVFRTNTAFDRYYEGRKIWTNMTNNVRIITRCVWIAMRSTEAVTMAERRTIINFAVAFPVAVKHYLREEYSTNYEDLKDLIVNLKTFKNKQNGRVDMEGNDNCRESMVRQSNQRRSTRRYRLPHPIIAQDKFKNLPIEIMYCIGIYINSLIERKITDPSIVRTLNFALNGLNDCLSGLERILTTPIPLAYAVHLHHALWIHLLSLPFQLVSTLKWWTIPAMGFTSFTLLGILAIGWEIENPFGYDYNDLPLDAFCKSLRVEVEEIMEMDLPTYADLFQSSDDSSQTSEKESFQSSPALKPSSHVRIQVNEGQNGFCAVGNRPGATQL